MSADKKGYKAYIIELCFGTWRNSVWFSGEAEACEAFSSAKSGLNEIGRKCKNAVEFFEKSIAHFESNGFKRIQK